MEDGISKYEIAEIRKLNSSSRYRNNKKKFVIENSNVINEIVQNKSYAGLIDKIFITKKYLEQNKKLISQLKINNIKYNIISEMFLSKITDTKSPQGIICILDQLNADKEEIIDKSKKGIILDSVNDPGNLGTILRSGAAFGIDFIIFTGESVDVYNPKVIRSTAGAIFKIPVFYMPKKEIMNLNKKGYKIASFSSKAKEVFSCLNYSGKIVFLFGNEARGIDKDLESISNFNFKIPIRDNVESLNLAVASSIVMYEMSRKR